MKKNRLNENKVWVLATILFVSMAVLWGLNWFLIKCVWYPGNPNYQGAFGDMFGAVSALFSGIAMIGVAVAVLYQVMELAEVKRTGEFEREITLGRIRPVFQSSPRNVLEGGNPDKFKVDITNLGETIYSLEWKRVSPDEARTIRTDKHPIFASLNKGGIAFSDPYARPPGEEFLISYKIIAEYTLLNRIRERQILELREDGIVLIGIELVHA